MKLAVKNLGPVSYAEVDLSKDLLIFTGENNSGKTYLAYTVHAIFDPNTIGMDIYRGDNIPFDENGKYEK
jgi:predicted ATPase